MQRGDMGKTARFGEDRGRGRFRDEESSYSKLSIVETKEEKTIGLAHFDVHMKDVRAGIRVRILEGKKKNKYELEATNLLIEYLFNTYPIERVDIGVHIEDKTTISMLEKCGFRKEGIEKKHGLYVESLQAL